MESYALIAHLRRKYNFEVFFDLPLAVKEHDLVGEVRNTNEVHLAQNAPVHTLLHEIGHIQDGSWLKRKGMKLMVIGFAPIAALGILEFILGVVFNPLYCFLVWPLIFGWTLLWHSTVRVKAECEKEERCNRFADREFSLLVKEGIADAGSYWRLLLDLN